MHQLQLSWVRSQHPSAQWNLGAADEAVLNLEQTKNKNPPKNIFLKKCLASLSACRFMAILKSSFSPLLAPLVPGLVPRAPKPTN
jgi:hypothetical protein